MKRSPLRSISAKKRAQDREWQKVRAAAMVRDDYTCQFPVPRSESACYGMLEVHHITPRSTAPHLILDLDNVVCLCSGHHQWVTDNPAEAEAIGLHGRATR